MKVELPEKGMTSYLPVVAIGSFLLAIRLCVGNSFEFGAFTPSNTVTNAASSIPDFSHLQGFCAHVPRIKAREYLERQQRLAKTLKALGASAFIVEPGASMIYYTNVEWALSERPFVAIIRPDDSNSQGVNVSFVSPYFEADRARLVIKNANLGNQVGLYEWQEHLSPYDTILQAIVDGLDANADHSTGPQVHLDRTMRLFLASGITEKLKEYSISSAIAAPEVQILRTIKSPAEIEIMRCANTGTVRALREVRNHIKAGQSESDIAAMIHAALKNIGLVETWVLALIGPSAALPHGEAGTNRVVDGINILMDAGGRLHGYESDITRTIFYRKTPWSPVNQTHVNSWYDVKEAQTRAMLEITLPNRTCADVDLAARGALAKDGLARYFTHRLGHGIGLEGHEEPYLNQGNPQALQAGMVFSIEPGVYVLGEYGIRLEDIVVVTLESDGSLGVDLLSGGLAKDPYDF